MTLRIITWNMDHWKGIGRHKDHTRKAWEYLLSLKPDVALLQESVPPTDLGILPTESVAVPDLEDVNAWRISENREWCSAVVSFGHALTTIPSESLARADESKQIPVSHPGCFQIATVQPGGVKEFRVVSLYGLQDGEHINGIRYAATTVHRMLSDLTPILDASRASHEVVLAGDFNISTQIQPPDRVPHRLVLERIEAFGLVDVIRKTAGARPRLTNCNCDDASGCDHAQTYRHPQSPIPWQDDYMFMSKRLAESLESCEVLSVDSRAWELSDHCPVVASLDLEG